MVSFNNKGTQSFRRANAGNYQKTRLFSKNVGQIAPLAVTTAQDCHSVCANMTLRRTKVL
jgi:hypothetical protein